MKLVIDTLEFDVDYEGRVINSNPPSEKFLVDEKCNYAYFKDMVLKFVDMSSHHIQDHQCERCILYQFRETMCGNSNFKVKTCCSPSNGSFGSDQYQDRYGYWIEAYVIQRPKPKVKKINLPVQTELEKSIIDQLL